MKKRLFLLFVCTSILTHKAFPMDKCVMQERALPSAGVLETRICLAQQSAFESESTPREQLAFAKIVQQLARWKEMLIPLLMMQIQIEARSPRVLFIFSTESQVVAQQERLSCRQLLPDQLRTMREQKRIEQLIRESDERLQRARKENLLIRQRLLGVLGERREEFQKQILESADQIIEITQTLARVFEKSHPHIEVLRKALPAASQEQPEQDPPLLTNMRNTVRQADRMYKMLLPLLELPILQRRILLKEIARLHGLLKKTQWTIRQRRLETIYRKALSGIKQTFCWFIEMIKVAEKTEEQAPQTASLCFKHLIARLEQEVAAPLQTIYDDIMATDNRRRILKRQ